MTIAGSDSGGGAGIQADLKTFAALGVYGTSVLTAITAQNTVEVSDVHEVPVGNVRAQIKAVLSDIGADAVKTGMLSSVAIINAVSDELSFYQVKRLVVDPVMVSKSGDRLLRANAVNALCENLFPMATVVTPNIPEAEVLTGMTITSPSDVTDAAVRILKTGAQAVIVKGGHLKGDAIDRLYSEGIMREFAVPRIASENTHGTGCTFASAIAAGLAQELSLDDAVWQAKRFVTEAIRTARSIGRGHGPLNHFH
ncbi:bifunctional hydroxymethylpyrimidine kinase/phosphomethylpyrimidine kinase [SAR202 cluster bacterium AD-804-J14_MRT_500m]|nr:bifunctional hydroxymethylpyrimidine kinase/phosphomethylpyrimidine kinase [SAR202 cluster bacterium AD-804-J14_MRT_500m]